jgi:hypothetical protein
MKSRTDKSNSVKSYILENLEIPDGHGNTPENPTTKEVLTFHYLEFRRVANYDHNLRRYPNEIARFADYIMGLPSGFNTAFTNYDILRLGEQWGFLDEHSTEKKQEVFIAGWFNHIANKFFQLCRKYEVTT